MTGFAKTVPIIVQQLKSNLLPNIKPTLLHYLQIPNSCMAIDDQVCFHKQLFANPVKLPRCTKRSVEPVNGINKDVSGVILLSTTASTYPVDWVSFCLLLKAQHCYLFPNGRYNRLWLPTHPNHPSHLLPLTHRYNVPSMILQSLWKSCSKSSSVS